MPSLLFYVWLIGIHVEDMARSLAFYRALGWDIPSELDSEQHAEITLDNGIRVGWDTHALITSFYPDWTAPSGGDRISMAFLCGSAAEVDTIYARLTGMGYEGRKAPWDAFWGQRYALIADADGNVIDLFAPLE